MPLPRTCSFLFFFQAEDGIRDLTVTGVQTCALPIFVISTINAAVEARVISAQKEEREAASKILPQPRVRKFKANRPRFIDAVRDALYASKIVSYTQGMELLRSGSTDYKWNLNLVDIATFCH